MDWTLKKQTTNSKPFIWSVVFPSSFWVTNSLATTEMCAHTEFTRQWLRDLCTSAAKDTYSYNPTKNCILCLDIGTHTVLTEVHNINTFDEYIHYRSVRSVKYMMIIWFTWVGILSFRSNFLWYYYAAIQINLRRSRQSTLHLVKSSSVTLCLKKDTNQIRLKSMTNPWIV